MHCATPLHNSPTAQAGTQPHATPRSGRRFWQWLRQAQAVKPGSIRGIFDQMAVAVWCAIGPPHRPALAQPHLGRLHRRPRLAQCLCVCTCTCTCTCMCICLCTGQRRLHCPPCLHELLHQRTAHRLWQCRIGRPPQPPAHHDVASVRGQGSRHAETLGLAAAMEHQRSKRKLLRHATHTGI